MNDKELDVLLVEGIDNEGYTLKFTLRGNSPKELRSKLVDMKAEWMGDMNPTNKPQAPKYGQQATSQRQAVPTDLGNCGKCGAPNKMSKAGKVYCSATCWIKKEY